MREIKAISTEIQWNDRLPIFLKDSFLRAVGNDHGWIAGIDGTGKEVCLLPYALTREHGISLARFRTETFMVEDDLSIEEEKQFLNCIPKLLRSHGVDIIIPATTNAVFRTFPDGAVVAPYGSYVVDLSMPEETLWKNMERITRQNINTAQKSGVRITEDRNFLDASYVLIKETFRRSRLPFMPREPFLRYIEGLGKYGKLLVAEHDGVLQSCVVYAYSKYCAYAVYGGNKDGQIPGANKLLHWEAMRLFRGLDSKKYDFVGARISPDKGSKADAINSFKRRLGGKLRQGYIWKCPLKPMKSFVYTMGVRLLRGGDIVDKEKEKMMRNLDGGTLSS
jgi:hypothetical protein